jgi:uncharacterized protein YegL
MSLIDRVPIARRKMILFFLIDTSGSMAGKKIQSVNDAIENVLPIIGEISDENPDAEINIAAMKFSTGVDWVYNEPKAANDFIWQPVAPEALTSLGEACRELNRKLSRSNGFMPTSTGSGYYAPAIILLSDGGPTDDFQSGLKVLKENSWFKNAIKVAIAIGDDADEDVLKDFTGSSEAVIKVHNIDALKTMIRVIAVTSSQIGSKSSSAGDASKQDEVIKEITESVKDTDGAESTSAPATGDNYDDWD